MQPAPQGRAVPVHCSLGGPECHCSTADPALSPEGHTKLRQPLPVSDHFRVYVPETSSAEHKPTALVPWFLRRHQNYPRHFGS